MKVYNIKDFKLGWFIGNFDPSIVKCDNFEIAVKHYIVGENDPPHYHKKSDEITVIISGSARMNGIIYKAGDILFIEKQYVTDFIPLENTITCVVKIPSVINDKYIAT